MAHNLYLRCSYSLRFLRFADRELAKEYSLPFPPFTPSLLTLALKMSEEKNSNWSTRLFPRSVFRTEVPIEFVPRSIPKIFCVIFLRFLFVFSNNSFIFAHRYTCEDFSQQGYKPKISCSCGQPWEHCFYI